MKQIIYLIETNPFKAFLWCILIIQQSMPSLPKIKYINMMNARFAILQERKMYTSVLLTANQFKTKEDKMEYLLYMFIIQLREHMDCLQLRWKEIFFHSSSLFSDQTKRYRTILYFLYLKYERKEIKLRALKESSFYRK